MIVVRMMPWWPPLATASSSILSGTSVHMAMAPSEATTTQCMISGVSQRAISSPTKPASAWLTIVARKMPMQIGQGLRYLAARINDSNWVLSPTSARATTPVAIRKLSTHIPQGPEQDASPRAPSDPGGTHEPAVLPGGGWRPSLRVPWLLAKCVDTRPAPCARSATPRWRAQILACPASCGNCAHHALADNVRPAYCRQVEYCPTSIQQARAQRARNIRHFFAQPDDLLFGCRHVGDHVAYLRT